MTDDDTESGGEQPADTDTERTDRLRAMEDEMAKMREMMEENTEMCREMHEEMMGGGDDGGDEESADGTDDVRTVTVDGEERSVDAIREEVAQLRDVLDGADIEAAETRDFAEGDEVDSDDDQTGGFGFN